MEKPKYRSLEQAVHLELLAPLGQQLLALRKFRRMTQAELAEKVNKGSSVVGKYEKGSVNLTISILAQLSQALDCKLEIVLTPFEHLEQ